MSGQAIVEQSQFPNKGPAGASSTGMTTIDGRPIKVRIVWTHADPDHARWEQSFSFDHRTWEVNWISDFTRADPAVLCPSPEARARSPVRSS